MSGIAFAGLYLSFLVIQLIRKQFKSVISLFFCVIAGILHYAVMDISEYSSSPEDFKVVVFFCIAAGWGFALDGLNSNATVPVYMLVILMFYNMIDLSLIHISEPTRR